MYIWKETDQNADDVEFERPINMPLVEFGITYKLRNICWTLSVDLRSAEYKKDHFIHNNFRLKYYTNLSFQLFGWITNC